MKNSNLKKQLHNQKKKNILKNGFKKSPFRK